MPSEVSAPPPVTGTPAMRAHDAYWRVKETGEPPLFGSLPLKLQQCWEAAAEAAWRDGVLHAIGRLGQLAAAAALPEPMTASAYATAARALREELKMAGDSAARGGAPVEPFPGRS